VTLIGRYSNEESLNSLRLTLTGQANGSTRTYTYDNLSLPLRNEDNDFLPRLWATRRVGWLMEQVRANGEQKELRDEIVDLGTRYGIVTPYTSYLAAEDQQISRNSNLFMVQPQTTPQRGFIGGSLNAPKKAAPSASSMGVADTGAAAVRQSKELRIQQEADSIQRDNTRKDAVRRVEGKTFYLIEGVWTDSEFKTEARLPETTLTFGSDEYFALLKQYPKLASYFSLAERVVVVFEGRVYRVLGSP